MNQSTGIIWSAGNWYLQSSYRTVHFFNRKVPKLLYKGNYIKMKLLSIGLNVFIQQNI
jgi:hypothetical protein